MSPEKMNGKKKVLAAEEKSSSGKYKKTFVKNHLPLSGRHIRIVPNAVHEHQPPSNNFSKISIPISTSDNWIPCASNNQCVLQFNLTICVFEVLLCAT